MPKSIPMIMRSSAARPAARVCFPGPTPVAVRASPGFCVGDNGRFVREVNLMLPAVGWDARESERGNGAVDMLDPEGGYNMNLRKIIKMKKKM